MRCCSSLHWCAVVVACVAGIAGGLVAGRGVEAGAPSGARLTPAGLVQPEDEAQPSPEEMMAQMKEMSRPVAEHDALKRFEGTWDCEAKFSMAGPDQPPTTSKGVSRNRVVMGGRYLVQHFQLEEFMGEAFEGMGIMGFDRATGRYVTDWVDNWSTGIMSMTGEYDEETRTMDWRGAFVMATPGGPVEMPAHHVVKQVDGDRFVMEFWELDAATGEERKGGEITYTRAD